MSPLLARAASGDGRRSTAALLPLRESATLQFIEAEAYPGEGSQGARAVAEFWRAYDALQAAQKK